MERKINILTFNIVELDNGTNVPAVSMNPLLALAVMNTKQR